MNTLKKLKNRWKSRRELKKVSKVFKVWYGITTNINGVVELPKDIRDAMFMVLKSDMEKLLKKELNYTPVESKQKAKMAVIFFEQNAKEFVEGFQIFMRFEDVWITKVGRNQKIEEVKILKLNGKVEYLVISPEWMECTEKTIADFHEIGKVISKELHPSKMEILYFA